MLHIHSFRVSRTRHAGGLPGTHLPGYWESIDTVLELQFRHAVFGHGAVGGRPEVEEHRQYWRDLDNAVAEAVAASLSEDRAADEVRLDQYNHYAMYESWFEGNVRAMYRHQTQTGRPK